MTYSNKNTSQLIASLKIFKLFNFYMLRKYTLKHVHYALCQRQIYNFQERNIDNDMQTRKYTLKHVHYALCQRQIYNFQESNINNDM